MRGSMKSHCDYGLRAVSFSSIATTGGWPRKPQSLQKTRMQIYNLVPYRMDSIALLALNSFNSQSR